MENAEAANFGGRRGFVASKVKQPSPDLLELWCNSLFFLEQKSVLGHGALAVSVQQAPCQAEPGHYKYPADEDYGAQVCW